MPLHTAVIPAAGMGTRFLPATKAVPKELMPIFDTPALQLVMDEAIGAGCDHIVVVSSKAKTGIEAYLAPSPDAVKRVRDSGRTELADRLARIGSDVRISVVYQDAPRGLGHAIGCARSAVGNEPFAVLLPDELDEAAAALDMFWPIIELTIELKALPPDACAAPVVDAADAAADAALETAPV